MDVCYITALILPTGNLYRSLDKYIACFETLAQTGVQVGVYLDTRLRHLTFEAYPNVRVLDYVSLDSSFVPPDVVLPVVRNLEKDTVDYLCIQLMKLQLLSRASQDPRIVEPALAWIDFGVFHMMKDVERVQQHLRSYRLSPSTEKIRAPGAWTPEQTGPDIWTRILWRFCGSFLVGRRERFPNAYEEQQRIVLAGLPRLTWEVNVWSQMTCFEWYSADHNDSLLLNA